MMLLISQISQKMITFKRLSKKKCSNPYAEDVHRGSFQQSQIELLMAKFDLRVQIHFFAKLMRFDLFNI